jgi:predicted DNA-binding transcriptional regulator AlpA
MADRRGLPAEPEWLSKKEVARKVGVSPRTVNRYVALGLLPQPVRFSRTCVRWRRQDLDESLDRLVKSVSTKPRTRRGRQLPTAVSSGRH